MKLLTTGPGAPQGRREYLTNRWQGDPLGIALSPETAVVLLPDLVPSELPLERRVGGRLGHGDHRHVGNESVLTVDDIGSPQRTKFHK